MCTEKTFAGEDFAYLRCFFASLRLFLGVQGPSHFLPEWPEYFFFYFILLHFVSVLCTNIDDSWLCLTVSRAVHALRPVRAAPWEQCGGPERKPRCCRGRSGSEHLQSHSGAAGTHQRGARSQEYPSGALFFSEMVVCFLFFLRHFINSMNFSTTFGCVVISNADWKRYLHLVKVFPRYFTLAFDLIRPPNARRVSPPEQHSLRGGARLPWWVSCL